MEERDDWPAWGRLIDEARDRLRPEVSQNEIARQLGMSGTNWRRIVQGVSGSMASARGVKTVARMAHAVGVTPKQLADTGREDFAEELRLLEAAELRASARRSDDNDVISIRRKDLIQLLEAAERLAQGLPPDESSAEGDESAG